METKQASPLVQDLQLICDALFQDAVNGHLLQGQVVTREQLGEIYEVARKALLREIG